MRLVDYFHIGVCKEYKEMVLFVRAGVPLHGFEMFRNYDQREEDSTELSREFFELLPRAIEASRASFEVKDGVIRHPAAAKGEEFLREICGQPVGSYEVPVSTLLITLPEAQYSLRLSTDDMDDAGAVRDLLASRFAVQCINSEQFELRLEGTKSGDGDASLHTDIVRVLRSPVLSEIKAEMEKSPSK